MQSNGRFGNGDPAVSHCESEAENGIISAKVGSQRNWQRATRNLLPCAASRQSSLIDRGH